MWTLLILGCVVCCEGKYLLSTDTLNDYDPIEEIQHAACRIATKEIQATANATITRQLRGVCTSKEFNNKLERLEMKIMKGFEYIQMIFEKNGFYIPNIPTNIQMNLLDNVITMDPKIESKLGKRNAEIMKFNSTLKEIGHQKEFYYYWSLDAKNIFQNDDVISDNFYCSGRLYYIKLTPHHLGSKYITLELKTVGLIRRSYRFIIMDPNDPKYDISSQILSSKYSHADMYRISGEKIRKFINSGHLTIKLIIYI